MTRYCMRDGADLARVDTVGVETDALSASSSVWLFIGNQIMKG
jgi:hypothetical protein